LFFSCLFLHHGLQHFKFFVSGVINPEQQSVINQKTTSSAMQNDSPLPVMPLTPVITRSLLPRYFFTYIAFLTGR
jgi:hypothetical protein